MILTLLDRQKAGSNSGQSQTGGKSDTQTVNINTSKGDKIIMGLLQNTQTYLSENPDVPQIHFDGIHKIDIMVPDIEADFTSEMITDLVSTIFELEDVKEIQNQVFKLVVERIGVLNRNAGNAEKTRTPKAGSSVNKSWSAFIKAGDVEGAQTMLDGMVQVQDALGITDRQLHNLKLELDSIRSDES